MKNKKIILGSGSPRRKELLENLGLQITVRKANINEDFPDHIAAKEVPVYLSEKKSKAITITPDEILITADTVVLLNDKILEKPEDKDHAYHMLKSLSSKSHEVVTGVSLRNGDDCKSFSVSTTVYFNELSEEDILYYIEKYKPYDKAGAYGIQEWIGMTGVRKIDGDFYNVVGLPVQKVYYALKNLR